MTDAERRHTVLVGMLALERIRNRRQSRQLHRLELLNAVVLACDCIAFAVATFNEYRAGNLQTAGGWLGATCVFAFLSGRNLRGLR